MAESTADDAYIRRSPNECRYGISNRSSTNSSEDQMPLLPEPFEQSGPRLWQIAIDGDGRKLPRVVLSLILKIKTGWTKIIKNIRIQAQLESQGTRRLQVDVNRTHSLTDERSGKVYVANRIRSNKYTPWTFFPRQLLAQFSKLANFYFACFAIMQPIPGLSTTGNYTNFIPLTIFISISMAREGFDDYRRHRSDKKENRQRATVLNPKQPLTGGELNWQSTQWRYLTVGDVVKVMRDEPVPADIVLLSSTAQRERNPSYVETIALDGEADLKKKQVATSVAEACAVPESLVDCSVEFVVEEPNPDLSSFKAKVTVNGQTTILNNNNVIYRGSILRNTVEAIAMIIYTGEECKIRINNNGDGKHRAKAPRLQSMLNKIVLFVFGVAIALSLYNTLAYQIWKSDVESKLFYLSAAAVPFHQEVFGFIIMFATMVPLSLYVSMEMIKLAQIYFLNVDVEMYDERSNTPFESRTSTINEELGQVTHIFSDKTGTLTNNEMELRRLHIAGAEWEHQNASVSTKPAVPTLVAQRSTKKLLDHLSQQAKSRLSQKARLLLLSMSLCNSCIPEVTDDCITFQASSPDELALIEAAREMGFLLRSRDNESIGLAISSPKHMSVQAEDYKVLDIIDFSTERRRMSIIVTFPDGRICVLCKGADSVIFERLKAPVAVPPDGYDPSGCQERNSSANDIKRCMQSVDRFAREGLRTLLFAYRFIQEEEYAEWRGTWNAVDTYSVDQHKMIESAEELIEIDLELAGATAIEDKLQQGVPDSIEKLSRANIKIWLLTGDKRETAINIGRSCGLIKDYSTIFILPNETDLAGLEAAIRSMLFTVSSAAHSVLIVGGVTLANICSKPRGVLEQKFYDLAIMADAVVCSRAQPSQKAQLVAGIKRRVPKSVTLAIGDGANDIAMIQEAHVGIDITGKEGLQAARSSDYSIAQFRFLPRLLLVHGRWNYIRTCKYALGTLWKEVVFFLTQALFQRWNGFTGTSLYEPGSLSMFNTLFTSLPVLVIGIFDKDLPAATLLAVPELYRTMGQRNGGLNLWVYCGWMAMAVADSMIVFFCMLFSFGRADREADNTLYAMGDLTFVAVIVVVSIKLQIIEMHDKSAIVLVSVFLCVGAAFLWNILLAATYPRTTIYAVRGEFFDGFGKNPRWWLTLLLSVTCVCVFECIVSMCRRAVSPTQSDAFRGPNQAQTSGAQYEDAARLREGMQLASPDNGSDVELQEFDAT